MPLDVARIRALRIGDEIHYFETVGSTMTEAARLLAAGAPEGTVVLANQQTAGIGRLGRSWISERDAGVYASILLCLPLSSSSLPIASLLLGLATAEAIHRATHVACDLRWPNDVLTNSRKVAGILTHLIDSRIVAGVGINVNQSSFPEGLRTPATSLRMESGGRLQCREEILVALLDSIDAFTSMLKTKGAQAILRAFTAASTYAVNRRVVVEDGGLRGITEGLDENGFLLLRTESGRIEKITSGGIRADPSA